MASGKVNDHIGLAVVTGASSGIGAEFARQFAQSGHDLLLIARRKDRLDALAAQLGKTHGVKVHVLPLDLADLDAAELTRREVERIDLPLKWLVNNAGYGILGPFESNSIDDYRRYVRVLAMAPIEFCHALLPRLRQAQPSHVINIASLAGHLPGLPGSNLYAGLKSMLIKFTEMLALECEMLGFDVTATVSCPGMTESEIFDNQPSSVDVQHFKNKYKFMPASAVVAHAIAAAKARRIIVVPGRTNQVAAFLAKHLPSSLMRRMTRAQSSAILQGGS